MESIFLGDNYCAYRPVFFYGQGDRKCTFLWLLHIVRIPQCFLYVSAGIYKLYYGEFAYPLNMSHILQQMNAEWFIFNNKGVQADTISYLIKHPGITQWLYRLACPADLSLTLVFLQRNLINGCLWLW